MWALRPDAWINDQAVEVDPEGETAWEVLAQEIDPAQPNLDYLQGSRNAPDWVRNWSGPFTIDLDLDRS